MVREQEHLEDLLNTYKQYLTSKSYKRKNDLKKSMQRKEKEWFQFQNLKQNEN